jgi:hypothetical protein
MFSLLKLTILLLIKMCFYLSLNLFSYDPLYIYIYKGIVRSYEKRILTYIIKPISDFLNMPLGIKSI